MNILFRSSLAIALLAPCIASAQLFKCQGPDGKVVFSDVRCEGPAAAAAKVEKGDGRYQLTDADKERIRLLEATQARPGVASEVRSGANLEISSIRSGQDARLTAEQRTKRDTYRTELGSADAKKRKDTLNALRELYSQ